MKTKTMFFKTFPCQIAVPLLACAIAIPAFAQQAQSNGVPQEPSSSAAAQPATQPQSSPMAAPEVNTPKEGFWGHVNPFARKKWVNDRVNPIKDRLSELDEVNAKNAHDIQDMDARAQAGIHQAQSTADAANQTASAAGDQAQKAGSLAQSASGHVDKLNTTVNGLDQYSQVDDIRVKFRGNQPTLSPAARKQLDDLAANLTGRQGYILEIEAHAPGAGSTGIQSSEHMAEAVKRYLITEHDIPVYRMHSVALGNLESTNQVAEMEPAKPVSPVKAASVQIRLMENSLAAK
jgi:outer membrane protein OmpA-like peptidoglycan-associated protein